jgi:uncharacterized membrane protein HdeD (DUF308 family)
MQTQYNPELGVVVIVGMIALIAAVIFVPTRPDASYVGKVVLAGLALRGIYWGVGEIRGAMRARYAPKKSSDG